jgi:hypothetical protein
VIRKSEDVRDRDLFNLGLFWVVNSKKGLIVSVV